MHNPAAQNRCSPLLRLINTVCHAADGNVAYAPKNTMQVDLSHRLVAAMLLKP
jgi:hypothetical protein